VQEAADRFSEGKEQIDWFLKNRTYGDDAMGGSQSKEAASVTSRDMEEKIYKKGGISLQRNGYYRGPPREVS
jgi:hypothetical protein